MAMLRAGGIQKAEGLGGVRPDEVWFAKKTRIGGIE